MDEGTKKDGRMFEGLKQDGGRMEIEWGLERIKYRRWIKEGRKKNRRRIAKGLMKDEKKGRKFKEQHP